MGILKLLNSAWRFRSRLWPRRRVPGWASDARVPHIQPTVRCKGTVLERRPRMSSTNYEQVQFRLPQIEVRDLKMVAGTAQLVPGIRNTECATRVACGTAMIMPPFDEKSAQVPR